MLYIPLMSMDIVVGKPSANTNFTTGVLVIFM